jgi:hypothetical protein
MAILMTILGLLSAIPAGLAVMYIGNFFKIPAIAETHGTKWFWKRPKKDECAKQAFESAVVGFVADTRAEIRIRFEILQMLIQEAVIFLVAVAAGAAYLAYDHIGQQALAALFWCTMTLLLLTLRRRNRKRFAIEEILQEGQRRLDEISRPPA